MCMTFRHGLLVPIAALCKSFDKSFGKGPIEVWQVARTALTMKEIKETAKLPEKEESQQNLTVSVKRKCVMLDL